MIDDFLFEEVEDQLINDKAGNAQKESGAKFISNPPHQQNQFKELAKDLQQNNQIKREAITQKFIAQSKPGIISEHPDNLNKKRDLGQPSGIGGKNLDKKDFGIMAAGKDPKPRKSSPAADLQNDSQIGININNIKEDSFQKMYSKELDLDEDEVPIILHELNDSAIHFISHEQYERSLSLLQKAQTLLDRLKFQKNPKDRFLIQVTMHNMALCFQKMGALEECALCLDACLHQINSQYLAPHFTGKPTKKLKKLKYECKIHMQVCALLSQLHRHEEALLHAKQAVQISQYLVNDLLELCEINVLKTIQAKKREQEVHEEQERIKATDGGVSLSQSSSQADLIYYDHNISMLERTALRVYPIIKEIQCRMVKHKKIMVKGQKQDPFRQNERIKTQLENQIIENQPLNMKVLLGYLNQSEWLYLLNIGNIMQITPLTIHDLYSNQKIDVELARDSILEKITFLAISYFCVSTELRFLVSSKEKLSFDPVYVKAESEFWHGKALEISCGFLPSESPLVTHILSSYQKHHSPVQQAIPEEAEEEQGLRVIRPERGIDKSQFQPIIKMNKHLNIALSPLKLSPNNHEQNKFKSENLFNQKETNPVQNNKQWNVQSEMEATIEKSPRTNQTSKAMGVYPSQRSIEISGEIGDNDFKENKLPLKQSQIVNNTKNEKHQNNIGQDVGVSDMIDYELQSFDTSDIAKQEQQQKALVQRSKVPNQQSKANQQATQPERVSAQTSKVVDSQNKIQMAVPSPNALASAMQQARQSLQEKSEKSSMRESKTKFGKQNHTQRQQTRQEGEEDFKRPNSNHQVDIDKTYNNQYSPGENLKFESFDGKNESISEEELIMLAQGESFKRVDKQDSEDNIQELNSISEINTTVERVSQGNTSLVNLTRESKTQPGSNRNRDNILQAKPQQAWKPLDESFRTQKQQLDNLLDQNCINDSQTAKDPNLMTQAQNKATGQNLIQGQSQRSSSKGKVKQAKKAPGLATQPPTQLVSANITTVDPLKARQNVLGQRLQLDQVQDQLHDSSANAQRLIQKRRIENTGQPKALNQQKVQGRFGQTSSTEGRSAEQQRRPPSSGINVSKPIDIQNQQRPDSRRMIGKRRQIKDQKQEGARSSSAGRKTPNLNAFQPVGLKMGDVNIAQTSSHVQLSVSTNLNQSRMSAQNYKTFHQSRKVTTTNSTNNSNSPVGALNKGGQDVSSSHSNRLLKHQLIGQSRNQGAQGNITMPNDTLQVNTTAQLNQSRSTIENNNSILIDRSLNENLILQNSSFETTGQSGARSRSFAKTGGLSKQSSRDVIMGVAKKKQQTTSNLNTSKSQGKNKPNKELLNFLNQATSSSKGVAPLIASQYNSNLNPNLFSNVEEFKKQLLIKKALENQTLHLNQQLQLQQNQNSGKQHGQKQGKNVTRTVTPANAGTASLGIPLGLHPHTQSQSIATKTSNPNVSNLSSQNMRKSANNTNNTQHSNGVIGQLSGKSNGAEGIQSQKILQTVGPQENNHSVLTNMQLMVSGGMQHVNHLYHSQIPNQILAYQTHQQAPSQGLAQGSTQQNQKKTQQTHNMIKKFLKERQTPQPPTSTQLRSSSSISPNNTNTTSAFSMIPQSQSTRSTALIDNFTSNISTGCNVAGSNSTAGSGNSKNGNKPQASKNLQAQALYQTAAASSTQTAYFTNQQAPSSVAIQARKNAAERFGNNTSESTTVMGIGPAGSHKQEREPTPVYVHQPYQRQAATVGKEGQSYPMMVGVTGFSGQQSQLGTHGGAKK